MADDSPTGTRPVQFIFLSSDAQPLTMQPGDRRFWLVDEAHTVPLRIDEGDTDRLLQAWNNWRSRPLPELADATLARAEQRATEHPSRAAPKCVDCAHYAHGDKALGNGPLPK